MRFQKFFDKFIYIIGVGGSSMTIPQVIKIWNEKNASGISLIAWFGYTIFSVLWLIYGILHREKPIIVTNITLNNEMPSHTHTQKPLTRAVFSLNTLKPKET